MLDGILQWRSATRLLALVSVFALQGCACLQSDGPINSYAFQVFRPHELVIYKPVAGQATIYLALQNNSDGPRSICLACYSHRKNRWYQLLSHDVVPVVDVTSEGAPILGEPEVRLFGASGEVIKPGNRFPKVIPDPSEFPLNEANYRRDFAIVIHPDPSKKIGATGKLVVKVTLARPKHPRNDDGSSQVATFRIPVTIGPDFRPETMTTETSQPSQ